MGKNSVPENVIVAGLEKRWCGSPELRINKASKTEWAALKFSLKAHPPSSPSSLLLQHATLTHLSDADA